MAILSCPLVQITMNSVYPEFIMIHSFAFIYICQQIEKKLGWPQLEQQHGVAWTHNLPRLYRYHHLVTFEGVTVRASAGTHPTGMLSCYNGLCWFRQAVRRRWSLHVSGIPGDVDLRPGRNVYPTSRFVCKHGYHTTKHYGQQEDGQINFNLEFEREYFICLFVDSYWHNVKNGLGTTPLAYFHCRTRI